MFNLEFKHMKHLLKEHIPILFDQDSTVIWIYDFENQKIHFENKSYSDIPYIDKMNSSPLKSSVKNILSYIDQSKSNNEIKIDKIKFKNQNYYFKNNFHLFNENGNTFILCITNDITSSINYEKTLERSEKIYRALLRTMPDAIAIIDNEGDIIKINDKMSEYSGYSREDIIGKSYSHFLKTGNNLLEDTIKNDTIRDLECEFIRKNKETFTAELSISCLKNEIPSSEFYIFIFKDITKRKIAEKKSAETQIELFELFLSRLSCRELILLNFLNSGYNWPKDKRFISKQMDVLPGTLDKFMSRIKNKLQIKDIDKIIQISKEFSPKA